MKEKTYAVRVSCMTYNHATYIVDAMNGFVMQQTRFPFVCTIVDDASTDGEQDVIKKYVSENFNTLDDAIAYDKDAEYGHVTFARHKTNKNCYFAIVYLNENHYSQKKSKAPYLTEWLDTKYVALCEGDDYWTDSLKLQKQVDFLEKNMDFVACFHRHSIYFEDEKRMTDKDQFQDVIRIGQKGLELAGNIGVLPQILTMVYKKGVLEQSEWYPRINSRSKYDQTMIYAFTELGKIWVMNDNMGVYRRHSGGVATSLSKKQAAEKMYYTWHDVFEVHQNEDTKAMYIKCLKQYYYYLVKHKEKHSEEEVKTLRNEYMALNEPFMKRAAFKGRLLKGWVLSCLKLRKGL